MWMSQLAKNTRIEERRIGSHKDGIDTIFTSWCGKRMMTAGF
jgi:hypothetical protein